MTTASQTFLTPKGRLVQGHPMEAQTKNMSGQPLVTKAGQPTQKFFVGVAFPKRLPNGAENAEFAQFYGLLVQAARAGFPQLFTPQGQCTHPRFAWKVMDGDGVDENGKSNATKEGFAGNWVVKFSTTFPPKCFYAGMYGAHQQINDKNVIRRGYYVRVSGSVEANGDANKPGLYVNVNMLELTEQGPEIVGGPDAAAVFGAAPVAAYQAPAAMPGAMPAAMPGGQPAMPGMPGAAFPGAAPAGPAYGAPAGVPGGMVPASPMMPGAPAMPGMPQMAVPPNPAFAAGPGAPAMPGMPAPGAMPGMPAAPQMPVAPAVPQGPQLTPAGQAAFPGGSYAAFIAGGWTDAALRQAGYVV